ncbi:CCAAT/enhancer-binding protein gamma isoform X1 [Hyperolius riggenbachi]|uniref:CCAAT/enhancer-binding protein gamma isoform X1 n=1 Tax=Hyperolius riggenbachi TaxID=752182 RepID=UPI0035A2F94C
MVFTKLESYHKQQFYFETHKRRVPPGVSKFAPVRKFITILPKIQNKADFLWGAVAKLISQKVVCRVPPEQVNRGFYSHVFLAQKPSGDQRMILNLKKRNPFLKEKKFRMENIYSVRNVLMKGMFLASIDLQDAYLHLPIHPGHQKYLRFAIQKGSLTAHYQFQALPFGLTSAPRIFTKIVAEMIQFLHLQKINVIPYLDDFLIVNRDKNQLERDCVLCLQIMQSLGWIINTAKSDLNPSKTMTFLGFMIDTDLEIISLTQEKIVKLMRSVERVQVSRNLAIRELMLVLGLMTSAIPAVEWAQAHSRVLQKFILKNWDKTQESLERKVLISREVKISLDWWRSSETLSGGRKWRQNNPVRVTTDASAWGAHCAHLQAQGQWSTEISRKSSNYRELLAVKNALISFQEKIVNKEVVVFSDNMVVISYLNKQGGTRSEILLNLSLEIMEWSEDHLLSLTAVHIRGDRNILADTLSRQLILEIEWELNPRIFKLIVERWGQPILDLFATAQNAKTKDFCSIQTGTQRNRLDTFSVHWGEGLIYAFLPFKLIQKVVCKIVKDKALVILVVPWWPKRCWFPQLKRVALEEPFKLPVSQDMVTQGKAVHPDPQWLQLGS